MSDQPSLLKRIDDTHVPMLIARGVLGVLFIYMAISKVGDPIKFLKDIHEFELLPETPPMFLNLAAISLPWIEILCGVLLLVGYWLRGASATLLAMLVAFTVAIFMRAMGIHGGGGISFCDIEFDCGCGSGPINTCLKLSENLSLIALAAIATFSNSRRFALQPLPTEATTE